MATRAVYTFTGFPQAPLRHLYLHHDGYPSGAACRFQTALQHCTRPVEFLDRFQRSQPGCIVLDGLEQAADAAYRYRLVYGCAPSSDLQVEAWCRSPAGPGWILRCARVPLVVFICRFLPGPPPV